MANKLRGILIRWQGECNLLYTSICVLLLVKLIHRICKLRYDKKEEDFNFVIKSVTKRLMVLRVVDKKRCLD